LLETIENSPGAASIADLIPQAKREFSAGQQAQSPGLPRPKFIWSFEEALEQNKSDAEIKHGDA